MIRYISLDWIDALSAEVASSEQLRSLAEHHQINLPLNERPIES